MRKSPSQLALILSLTGVELVANCTLLLLDEPVCADLRLLLIAAVRFAFLEGDSLINGTIRPSVSIRNYPEK